MALNMQRGTLLVQQEFKLTGQDRHRTCEAGHVVRYSRSPAHPGEFVVWADAGLKWYLRCPAIQLPTIVKEST